MMYWTVPKIWQGERCFIIGGGPSLTREFGIPDALVQKVYSGKEGPEAYSEYFKDLHDKRIIAINMAYRLGSWVDVVFFGDGSLIKKTGNDILNSKMLKVSCSDGLENYHHKIKILRKANKHFGIDFDPSRVCWNFNSGAAAINLATHLGVSEVVLLGFDMKLDDGKNQHWHKFYSGNPKTVRATFNRHLKGFPFIEAQLRGKVNILNACEDSRIEVFKKVSVKDIL